MNPWPDLVKTALLGTRREPLELEAGGSPLARLLAQLAQEAPEHQLLCSAGAADFYQQSGAGPARSPHELPGPPLPADPRPICGPETAQALRDMLNGPRRRFLPEFLAAASAAGLRFPPSLVPNLLALGAKSTPLRPAIIPLLSPGDRHLAGANPEWLYAAPAIETWAGSREIWQGQSQVGKTRLLQQLREVNPNLARELLQSTWKMEMDNARINLIRALTAGLNESDEPFLEMALDDRSSAVRRQAAELLASLPASRLAARMVKHTAQYLRWTAGADPPIAVSFPTVSPAMVRDGIFGAQSKNKAIVRSRELIQMVGAVPLDHWTTAWHPDPAQIVRAVMETNWKRTLTSGFAEAAYRQRDGRWAKILLWERGPDLLISKLFNVLTTADYGQWLDHLIALNGGHPDLQASSPLFKSIRYRTSFEDLPLATRVLSLAADHLGQDINGQKPNVVERQAFTQLAYTLPVTVVSAAVDLLGDPQQIAAPWRPTAEEMVATLLYRAAMLEVIAGDVTHHLQRSEI